MDCDAAKETKTMRHILRNFLVWLRYRKIQFKEVGKGAVYQSLKSTYTSAQNIEIGNDVHIGPGANFDAAGGITVGNGAIFAPDVTIYTRTHNFRHSLKAIPFDDIMWTAPVTIGRYSWIGAKVIILPGVTVGEGAVIGAGSVVTREVPPCTIYAGNPAKQVGTRDADVFARLAENPANFCYRKHGHEKVFKPMKPVESKDE